MGMIHHELDRRLRADPGGEFASIGSRRLTYAGAHAESTRLAAALRAAAVPSGTRVAILSRNSLEMAAAFFGISRAGAVAVPLNYRLTPAEWRFILADCGASVLIASQEFAEAVGRIAEELPALRCLVLVGEVRPDGWAAYHEWTAVQPDTAVTGTDDPDSDAVILYTSGTTGSPKGVVWSHAGMASLIESLGPVLGVQPGDRALIVLPLFHIFGYALCLCGVRFGYGLELRADFHPAEIIRCLDEDNIAFAPLVPAMIQACVQAASRSGPPRHFRRLRSIIYGASPMPEKILRAAVPVFRCGLIQLYGMTELSPISALSAADHRLGLDSRPELLISAGRPTPGVEIRIVAPDDCDVPPGGMGEILVRAPHLMRGYYGRPDATEEILRDGWVRTGDAGSVDADGFLYIRDRIKDIIVSAAENISTREVEAVLSAMPGIAEVAVIGIPHPHWGESVHAVVAVAEGAVLNVGDVIDFARSRMARFKCPKSVEFVASLPRNAAGKVLKRALREPHWKGLPRRI